MRGLIAALVVLICAWTPETARAEEILVSAAASLTDVLKEIAAGYHAKSRNNVRFNFGASNALARQIEAGAPADIFFSADLAQMHYLDNRGLLEPGAARNVVSNQLVIVVPSDSKLAVAAPKDLLKPEIKTIALAEPSAVPVGVYSSKYLADEGLWDQLKPKIVPVQDVRATVAAVESGNVDAGFVYKTDAAISKKVKVAYEVPVAKGPRILYPAAVVKESQHKNEARAFLNYLSIPEAKAIFKKYGFVTLD